MNPADAPRVPLEDLYQEVILDHNRRPRNFKAIESCGAHSHGFNPLCGDDYDIYLSPAPDGTIGDIGFTGKGCAISKASGSMMTAKVKGKSPAEAQALKEHFLQLVTSETSLPAGASDVLGSLNIFAGVKKYPIRVKCATLVWHALDEALRKLDTKSAGGKP